MISYLVSKLTYGNVMATLALFIALGGTSYAITKLPKNSVGSTQIRKNAVTQSKLANNAISPARIRSRAVTNAKLAKDAVTGDKVKDNSLTGADIDESTLVGVPLSSTNLSLSCPSDTQAHAGVCIEKTARDAAAFASASRTCGQANRRLALFTELESYRQENGVALDNGNNDYELTANISSPNTNVFESIGIDDGGNRFNIDYDTAKRYRCVALPTAS